MINGIQKTRFHLIDGLRGIAALMVVLHHLPWFLAPELTKYTQYTLNLGYLGVEIFFVISGFVIAYSLSQVAVTPGVIGRFIFRRVIRLDPPYWASICFSIAVAALSGVLLKKSAYSVPAFRQVLIHMIYATDLLGIPQICAPYWTLCVEVQFYIVFVLLLWLSNLITRLLCLTSGKPAFALFAGVSLWSIAIASGVMKLPVVGLFIEWWHLFFIGVLLAWVVARKSSETLFIGYAVLLVVLSAIRRDEKIAVAVVTATLIWIGCRTDHLGNWLSGKVFQYFGKISYSLYLFHWPMFRLINVGVRVSGTSAGSVIFWNFLAVVLSIAMAHIVWRLVEVPSIAFSKRISLLSQNEMIPAQIVPGQ